MLVTRLDRRSYGDLYTFLTTNRGHDNGLEYIDQRRFFLEDLQAYALGARTETGELVQVIFGDFLHPLFATTRGIYGAYGDHTRELLDLLCATCASRTPPVERHELWIGEKNADAFATILATSRLQKFMTKLERKTIVKREPKTVFSLELTYPTA